MATQAQIEANRRNSQKSTGPRTDAGKAASSQNATRTGLYANSLLIDGEDPDELESLARGYLDSCRPIGPRERAVVDSLIHTDWLLRRLRRVENQSWNRAFESLRESRGAEFDENYGLVIAYNHTNDRQDRIQRRVTTLERLYHRRLVDLERLQAQRPPQPEPVPEPIAPPSPDPETLPPLAPKPQTEIGFVSSKIMATDDPGRNRATVVAPRPSDSPAPQPVSMPTI